MAYSITRNLHKLVARLAAAAPRRLYGSSSGQASHQYSSEKETHFGYENVSEEEKAQKVHGVFENVASNYDLMNDLMSGGIHRVWKDCFLSRIRPRPDIRLLDVAGGTGDIAFRFVQHILPNEGRERTIKSSVREPDADTPGLEQETNDCPPPYEITVCDISQNMLDVGQMRAEKLGYNGINWICGDAQKLPFPDDEFDCYTIAFGIRNVVDIEKALDEAYRVLKPGGRFMCLEFSHVKNSLVRWMYDQYSFNMIPALGQVVAGDWKSYQYLVESIRKFPDQESFKEMIEYAGFRCTTYENLTLGVAAIHSGFKI